MHTFFLDLWHDLREKRLWPVAALLLVGIVAVPLVLSKEEQPASSPVAPPTRAETASDRLPTIALDDVSSASPSKLSEFSQRNPFKPLNDLPKAKADDEGENKTVDLGESPDGGSKGDGSAAGGSSAGGSRSDSGGASPAGSGGGSAPEGGSSAGPRGPRTTYYAYRADMRFGPAGRTKAMKQVKAFTLLGGEEKPAAMFMGVTDDHRYAVFTVDTSNFTSEGEQECKPTPERCEFVYLKVGDGGNETTFTTLDGQTSYDLELTAIKRVVLDKSDVENVPTENKKPDDTADAPPAGKGKVVEPVTRSLFDILAQRR